MNSYLTIPGFEQMSQQELFDASVAHVATTRQKSVQTINDPFIGKPVQRCVYGGCGCAASPFLTPEGRTVADGVDGASWGRLASLEDGPLVPEHEAKFVSYLQDCHDDAHNEGEEFVRSWKQMMKRLAFDYNLDTSKLDAVEV